MQGLETTGGKFDMPHAIKRPGTADEVAQLALFLLSDASQYITGAVYSIDGGWNC
jgi:NAD(P)-dependent dehydrogenase (short-subunit alcohol dehydrogenase family)